MTTDDTEPQRDNINYGSPNPDWTTRNATKNEPGPARTRRRTRFSGRDSINGSRQQAPTSTRSTPWTWSVVDRKP